MRGSFDFYLSGKPRATCLKCPWPTNVFWIDQKAPVLNKRLEQNSLLQLQHFAHICTPKKKKKKKKKTPHRGRKFYQVCGVIISATGKKRTGKVFKRRTEERQIETFHEALLFFFLIPVEVFFFFTCLLTWHSTTFPTGTATKHRVCPLLPSPFVFHCLYSVPAAV